MLRILILAEKVLAREERKGKEKDFFYIILSMVFSPTVNRLNSGIENNYFRLFYSNNCGG